MGKKVLSVDDSSTMRQIIKSCLEKEGYAVTEATDGLDGLEKVRSEDIYDLFLVDVNMPNMDGISFVKEIRKDARFSSTPILMLTTESLPEKKAEGAVAGATGWIIKPFNPDDFIKTINRVTG